MWTAGRRKIQCQICFLDIVNLLSRIFHKGIISQNADFYSICISQRKIIHIDRYTIDIMDLHHIMHHCPTTEHFFRCRNITICLIKIQIQLVIGIFISYNFYTIRKNLLIFYIITVLRHTGDIFLDQCIRIRRFRIIRFAHNFLSLFVQIKQRISGIFRFVFSTTCGNAGKQKQKYQKQNSCYV